MVTPIKRTFAFGYRPFTLYIMKLLRMRLKKTNTLQVLTNILIWLFLFVLPLMLWRNEDNVNLNRLGYNHAIGLLFSAFIFYFNYFFLTERFLFRKRTALFILTAVATILICAFFSYMLKDLWWNEEFSRSNHNLLPMHKFWFYMREFTSLAIMAGISIMAKVLIKWNDTEAQRQEEEKRRKEAELQNLRQQINPHFFFNTLNNIYALIAISPEKAQETVLELSKLMRYVLYENNHYFVLVHKELDFIRNYIELMRIRLTDNVDVQVDIDVPTTGKQIAPMIFVSLIENAFKHGTSPTHPSFIHVDIHQVEDRIVCLIRNSYFPKDDSDKSGSGIGLENLHRRLDILYPHQHILRTEEKDGEYVCELIVPLV